tara:strand:+ start:257 stop:526 length:270 start_codon:yes stop_codon:yes gene_type:complete
MKYALIEGNVVKQISYIVEDGYIEVSDDVFADMVKKDDGSYDYTDEVKAVAQQVTQEETDRQTNRASGKAKLKELGLTDAQINALMGVE